MMQAGQHSPDRADQFGADFLRGHSDGIRDGIRRQDDDFRKDFFDAVPVSGEDEAEQPAPEMFDVVKSARDDLATYSRHGASPSESRPDKTGSLAGASNSYTQSLSNRFDGEQAVNRRPDIFGPAQESAA